MSPATPPSTELPSEPRWLAKPLLQSLLELLWSQAYRVMGPTVSQGAIVYDEVRAVDDLPRGWTDEQSGGHYRLKRRDDDALFGFVVGPHSWKRYLFPPQATVATSDRSDEGWQMHDVAMRRASLRVSRRAGLRTGRHRRAGSHVHARSSTSIRSIASAASGP